MDQQLLHHDLRNIDQDHNKELEQLLTLHYNILYNKLLN